MSDSVMYNAYKAGDYSWGRRRRQPGYSTFQSMQTRPQFLRKARRLAGSRRAVNRRTIRRALFPAMANPRRGTIWPKTSFASELKFKTIEDYSTQVDDLSAILILNSILRGAGPNERVGNRIIVTRITLEGYLLAGPTGLFNPYDILIVYDKQPPGFSPSWTDVMSPTAGAAIVNMDTNDRFVILKRFRGVINGNQTPTTGGEVAKISWTGKFNLPVEYKNVGTSAYGDFQTGVIFMTSRGTAPVGTPTAASGMLMSIRLRYYDY